MRVDTMASALIMLTPTSPTSGGDEAVAGPGLRAIDATRISSAVAGEAAARVRHAPVPSLTGHSGLGMTAALVVERGQVERRVGGRLGELRPVSPLPRN
jgi:hypothetical protein